MKRIYISGRITGITESVSRKAFKNAQKHYESLGYEVVNPWEIDPMVDEPTWSDYMAADISELFKCDTIYMLSGWENSKGAKVELAIAQQLELTIIYKWRVVE